MSAPFAAIYDNRTVHTRFAPFRRRFSYRVRQLLLDIDHIGETAAALKHFGYNTPALFSFFDQDHGDRTGAPLRPWAEAMFARAGVALDGGAIRLLTFPRVFGRVFNPLSLFFGYGPDGALRGVIYEVNNTFGETHAYVAAVGPEAGPAHHEARKLLYVSPFFDVRGGYKFTVAAPDERFSLVIENIVDGARVHLATLGGRRQPLTDSALLAGFLALPWMGFRVLFAIHWQAFWLWLKGAGYRAKPVAPLVPASRAHHTLAQPSLDKAA